MSPILEWKDISVRRSKTEYSLFEVSGHLERNRLTCLVGPSGAGKSVLLKTLSGRIETTKTSSVIFHDDPVLNLSTSSAKRSQIGFVSYDDVLLSSVTPKEALEFSYDLTSAQRSDKGAKARQVEYYLSLLDLDEVSDVAYGRLSSLNAKRFASIAVEMITERKVLLLDAPLAGLSQLAGYQFIKNLKKLVAHESTVLQGILCTLLQPTSEVLSLFDDIILMADHGVVIYQGPVADMAASFAKLGHKCPQHYNVSDFALFVLHSISKQERDSMAFALRKSESQTSALIAKADKHKMARRAGFYTQLNLLTVREIKDVLRNWRSMLVARFVISIIISLVIGAVYYQIGTAVNVDSDTNAIHAYRGCVLVMCCNAMLANAQATVLALPLQKAIFRREYALNMYSSMAYLLSKFPMELSLSALQVLVQLVISYFLCGLQGNFAIYWVVLVAVESCAESVALSISCLTSSALSAIQTLPIAILPQIIFSGLIVSIKAIPKWISWLQYICFIPYAMKLLCINEFGCTSIAQFTSNDIECSFLAFNGITLVAISLTFRIIALIALWFEPKSKYRS